MIQGTFWQEMAKVAGRQDLSLTVISSTVSKAHNVAIAHSLRDCGCLGLTKICLTGYNRDEPAEYLFLAWGDACLYRNVPGGDYVLPPRSRRWDVTLRSVFGNVGMYKYHPVAADEAQKVDLATSTFPCFLQTRHASTRVAANLRAYTNMNLVAETQLPAGHIASLACFGFAAWTEVGIMDQDDFADTYWSSPNTSWRKGSFFDSRKQVERHVDKWLTEAAKSWGQA